jgi:hypothetical protein
VTLAALAAVMMIVSTDPPVGVGVVGDVWAKTGAIARMAPVAAAAEADPILDRLILGKFVPPWKYE